MIKKSDVKPEPVPLLSMVENKYGFIPNLMSVLADSSVTLQAYLTLADLVSKSAFTPEEQQAILLATSVENNCEYCVAAHSMVAIKMAGVSLEKLEALRDGKDINDNKLNELVRFTKKVVSERGFVDSDSVASFLNAGYTNQHILEVLLGVTMKTLSNYTNHIAKTPIDQAFVEFKWSK